MLQKLESEIRKEIDEAVKLAKTDKEAPLSEVTADVYAENLEPEIRNVTPFNPLKHSNTRRSVNL